MGNNFLRCLAIGKAVEKEAISELTQRGFTFISQSVGCVKEWDFLMSYNGVNYYFECKYDAYSCKNGDVAIEYLCSNKPSGISTSIANIWVIRACNTMFVIDSNKLKQLINSKKYYRIAKSSKTEMYIFRKDFLLQYSKIIKNYE